MYFHNFVKCKNSEFFTNIQILYAWIPTSDILFILNHLEHLKCTTDLCMYSSAGLYM